MNMNQLASSRSLRLTVPFALLLASISVIESSFAQNGYVPPPIPGAQQQRSGFFDTNFPRHSTFASGQSSKRGKSNPAYNQLPTPAAQPAAAAPATPPPQPTIPGQLTGPVAYPKLDETPPPAPKPATTPTAPTTPPTDLNAELVDLRKIERNLDQRLTTLEHGGHSTPQPGNSLNPPGNTSQITYVPHQVGPRETIWGIADRYGISAEDIRRTNRGSDFISTGDILYIPQRVMPNMAPAPEPAAPRQVSMQTKSPDPIHIVRQGDTLTGIAAKYHVSARAIQNMNGIKNPKTLSIGRKLTIPGGAAVATKGESDAPPAKKAAPKAADQHFVNKETTKPTKVEPAKATPEVVKAQQPPAAKAPSSEPPSHRALMSYRIEADDDIDGVAKFFRTTAAEIRRLNRIDKLPAKEGVIVVPMPGSGTL